MHVHLRYPVADPLLKQLSFKAEPTSYNELSWALAFYYLRNDIYVQVIPQNKALKSPERIVKAAPKKSAYMTPRNDEDIDCQ